MATHESQLQLVILITRCHLFFIQEQGGLLKAVFSSGFFPCLSKLSVGWGTFSTTAAFPPVFFAARWLLFVSFSFSIGQISSVSGVSFVAVVSSTSNKVSLCLLCSATQRYVSKFCFHIGYDLIMFFSHTHVERFSITNNITTFHRAKSKLESLWSLMSF